MIQGNVENINSPVRRIKGKVELLESSTTTNSGEIIRADYVAPFEKIKIKTSSKNLIPYPYSAAKIENGITFTDNGDGSVSVKGTATANAFFYFVQNMPIKAGTYYVSGTSADADIRGIYLDSDGSNKYFNKGVITFPIDTKISLYVVVLSGQNVDYTVSPQLEKGEKATPYTPYININNSTSVIKAYGKNLIPYPYYYNNNRTINGVDFTINEDRSVTVKGTATENAYFYLQVGYDYGASMNSALTGANSATNGAYTVSKRMMYWNKELAIVVYKGDTADETLYPQLEVGTTATAYEPYKEATIYPAAANIELEIPPRCNTTTLIASTGLSMDISYTNNNPKTEYAYNDNLQSITIERVPDETKFFGYGISQCLNIHLRDIKRDLNINTSNGFKVYFAAGDDEYINNFPNFYVTKTYRDEKTNELSITAYDPLYKASEYLVNEIQLKSYTILQFAEAIAARMGLGVILIGVEATGAFSRVYTNGANFEGTESLREALDDIAEATQTIYYVSGDNLVFKRLDINAEAALRIGKASYMELENKDNRRLSAITHATELGDNVSSSIGTSGTTQFVRDNAFWTLRDNIGEIVEEAISAIGGLTIGQFNLIWRGNYLLDLGDKIEVTTKDDETLTTYLLNDVIEYNGAFTENTSWNYQDNSTETFSNPSTLGDALKMTFAKVDKQNKKIELIASDINEQNSVISGLEIELNGIKTFTEEEIEGVKKHASTYLTKDEYSVLIQEGIEGQNYKFTKDGLKFVDTNPDSKKEVETVINNKGMTVNGDGDEKLIANDEGVIAVDLTAKTFLIIGNNSRLENYNGNKTACFWIGG